MAKALGLIGNFTGKLGNTVGYNLKDSNNKQTQGVRVYQPVVKNPKTSGQAEQRAKLAPINATYRVLKDIIDRGQEGKAYGNKSRLAWLSNALKSFIGGWFEKGANIVVPAWVHIAKGSLPVMPVASVMDATVSLDVSGIDSETDISTIGKLSNQLIQKISALQNGDQLTFVGIKLVAGIMQSEVFSIVLDTTSAESTPSNFAADVDVLGYTFNSSLIAGAIILSREGADGSHLRSNARLVKDTSLSDDHTSSEQREAAIASYMSAGANTDWAEESIQ